MWVKKGKFIMENRLLRDRDCVEMLNISRSTWWAGVKSGRFPKPIKLTERTSRWKLSDIIDLIERGD